MFSFRWIYFNKECAAALVSRCCYYILIVILSFCQVFFFIVPWHTWIDWSLDYSWIYNHCFCVIHLIFSLFTPYLEIPKSKTTLMECIATNVSKENGILLKCEAKMWSRDTMLSLRNIHFGQKCVLNILFLRRPL